MRAPGWQVSRACGAVCTEGAACCRCPRRVLRRVGSPPPLWCLQHNADRTCLPAAALSACLWILVCVGLSCVLCRQFIVCARTDARSVEGLDAVVERAKVYVDSGADMIFPEGLHTAEEFQYVADALKGYGGAKNAAACGGPYLLANMTEFGKTPIINHAEFERMGYHCVIYPVSTLRSAMGAVAKCLGAIKQEGEVTPVLDDMLTRKDLYAHLGYTPGVEWTYPDTNSKR
eukprot:TRINITY_DN3461_c0_g1_i1.p1 TRINITY_DN3461_c0_g1~~TRINITY_DN3461_c0_g1_i1.p1  ORF type:complete len:231 (+),score=46.61 TRINITY_DN3461_c0_g1_i1:550-1242(+)